MVPGKLLPVTKGFVMQKYAITKAQAKALVALANNAIAAGVVVVRVIPQGTYGIPVTH